MPGIAVMQVNGLLRPSVDVDIGSANAHNIVPLVYYISPSKKVALLLKISYMYGDGTSCDAKNACQLALFNCRLVFNYFENFALSGSHGFASIQIFRL